MVTLLSFPTELLLCISSHNTSLSKNGDLASLSLVCHRFRPIAQEVLLCNAAFKLTHIHEYLWQLGHHSHLIPKIHRLQLYSYTEGRIDVPPGLSSYVHDVNWNAEYPAIRCPATITRDKNFMAKCEEIIKFYGDQKSILTGYEWREALDDDIVQALFSILIVSLPNLKELRVSTTWLMDMPVFSTLLIPHASGPTFLKPRQWRKPWMIHILNALKRRLEVLEFPANMDYMLFDPRRQASFTFTSFTHLRHLSITMDALANRKRPFSPPANPTAIFPSSLEMLRISECSETTANLMNELCLAKKRAKFPNLQCVQLYFYAAYDDLWPLADIRRCPDPLYDTRRMFTGTSMRLYLYFPVLRLRTKDIGGTPWSFQDENMLLAVEQERYGSHGRVRRAPMEMWTDFEGDIEMKNG